MKKSTKNLLLLGGAAAAGVWWWKKRQATAPAKVTAPAPGVRLITNVAPPIEASVTMFAPGGLSGGGHGGHGGHGGGHHHGGGGRGRGGFAWGGGPWWGGGDTIVVGGPCLDAWGRPLPSWYCY